MAILKSSRSFLPRWRTLLLLFVIYLLASGIIRYWVPPPVAVAIEAPVRAAVDVRVLSDDSWLDEQGERQLAQNVFDSIFNGIRSAKELVVVDMFLFNEWQGPVPETHRALSSELSQVLIDQQKKHPEMTIVVISDPINTVYGGLPSVHFNKMQDAGIHVVFTKLEQLQDSNPLWSGVWRWLIRPFGNSPGTLLPNPFGEGRVSVRSYLALLNFKANHRKLLIADSDQGDLRAWLSSANPHDGSSAHRNIALQFKGQAVTDLLLSEQALLKMSDASDVAGLLDPYINSSEASTESVKNDLSNDSQAQIQIISESRIHDSVVAALDAAAEGDHVDLMMFYLSERAIIKSLIGAHQRGAAVRVALDVNSDAFGRQKNGVPNRPVAAELESAGIAVRWCATKGEQCHAKWLHVGRGGESEFFMGSANFTKRNLLDLNMETNARVMTQSDSTLSLEMLDFFERQWSNANGRIYTTSYDKFADDSIWLTAQYRFMELTGLSTF